MPREVMAEIAASDVPMRFFEPIRLYRSWLVGYSHRRKTEIPFSGPFPMYSLRLTKSRASKFGLPVAGSSSAGMRMMPRRTISSGLVFLSQGISDRYD